MTRPVVRAVLLDVDDTLVDTRGAFRAAVGGVVRRWLPHLDQDATEAAVLRWAQDPCGAFRRFTRGELGMAQQRRIRVTDLHATFGGPEVDESFFAEWDAVYEETFRAAWAATPDGVRLVERLHALGMPFGAVTNLPAAYQETKLRAVGLGTVPVLGSLDTVGVGKPDPRVFLAGCAALGRPPGDVLYVGDERDVDAVGAGAAGLVGVWLDRFGPEAAGPPGRGGWDPVRADDQRSATVLRIRSLDRLEEVVELRADRRPADLGQTVPGR